MRRIAAYYAWVDTVWLWEYCLWRLQGIFEGLIVTKFLPYNKDAPQRLIGIKTKLDAMEAAGYSLSTADRVGIMEWAELRNELSHLPPEQYRPIELREDDLLEYRELVFRLCTAWREEKARMQGVK